MRTKFTIVILMPKTKNDKIKFSKRARRRLLDLDLSVKELADMIGRPRESVSRCIHSNRFPKLRAVVAQALEISQS